ncbi:MAG: hypothetical protein ACRD26_06580 [Vicinamibacterales bacterium]
MKIVTTAAAILLLVWGNDLAGAQTPQERINTGLARAREAGIPVALLESKIAEGKAKGVSLERIAAAVERREAALERASQALGRRADVGAADLGVAADAIESGVSEAVLRAIAETAPRERRVVAIAALTQLVQQGHVPEAALERVREALARGPEALLNLPAQAAGAADRRGGPPSTTPAGGRGGAEAGPPSGIPAPGGPPQSTKPGGPARPIPVRPTTPPRPGGGSRGV